ncbi:(E2-independent) E3 ubiquitin-conjugating enzyme FATS isoform X5 [Mus musculus]|uniref:(E2-independent) E3 ubiquitin-conjugating enzyme FATS isoform X5 n=1 Tax=Mus musculus TaxID=10090 RepID=UPI0005AB9CBC|nr:(E2-independent) E3 ubiquitin-conjugating enzyme FATS isoform X5 [Mus musculus]|eukprot:XP_011240208.1 PREDICTED: centrosomal protein C10orf90 homolog isoform X5 [Mus musculus]
MPVKPPEEGKAVHPTFQITAFSTSLKNHVMVSDLVKRGWLPSQRRAKVCFIHTCPSLKVTEQPASGYEETLASQNTRMISPVVISRLIDEKKSMENGAILPQAIAQPQLCPTKPALARRDGVSMHRRFALSPDRLGILTPSDDQGLETEPLSTGDNLGKGSHSGFSSITITARRVGPPASSLVWDTFRDPLCPKCKAKDALFQEPPVLAGDAHLCQHNRPFTCTESPSNGSVEGMKVFQAHSRLSARQDYWVTHTNDNEDSFSSDNSPSRKVPLVFSSCVHFRVSQQCPNAIYYLDKSLSVPLERPQIASPKMHRSVLSLSLRCSSHQLTADGVDSSANGEPISTALSQELSEGKQDLLGPQWGQPQGGHWKESPALVPVHLGSGTCPRTGSPPLENVKFADVGRNQVPVRKEKEDHATCTSSSHTNQLSIHIPGWSYRADYTCCDLVVKLKECEKNEDPTVTPEPSPATPSPSTPEGAQSSDPSEDSYEPLLASSMTLQEALEVHRPQFISRSQERLQKLKRMVQQRKTQQKESLGQKQSLLPVRANKKQFTIPHPLSDNLFKPKERCISEKEMHMRSKRIYNNLPEVKKKKEEQKKRMILQSNRLRAEVFKKQLLDQLLQRNAV